MGIVINNKTGLTLSQLLEMTEENVTVDQEHSNILC